MRIRKDNFTRQKQSKNDNGGKIMKTNKNRLFAALTATTLALTPCFAAGMSAMAEGETPTTHKITVSASKAADSDFSACQIFKGDVEGDKLTNITWGSSKPADLTNFLKALKGEAAFGEGASNKFAGLSATSTAEDYAKVMSGIASTTDGANALARILGRFFTTAITDTDPAKNIIDGVEPGYYLVKETTAASEQNPISLNLLKVVGTDVPITTKEDLPSINKLIDEKGGIEANTASIGDVVPYIITSKVPDMTGYNKYFFILNDTLSTGLTYVDNSISITVGGGAPLTAGTDYTFTESSGAIKIVFNDFYGKYNDNVGDAIREVRMSLHLLRMRITLIHQKTNHSLILQVRHHRRRQ